MQIEVLSVSVENKGKYSMAEVAYKKDGGEVKSKKLMSFGAGVNAYNRLTKAKQGEIFTITEEKNDKGYLDWIQIVDGAQAGAAVAAKAGNPSPKSTYETAEERANRQVLIVRQSSLSNAVAFFALNNKKAPAISDVIEVASSFENYVFGKTSSPDPMEDLESDII